MGVNDTRTSHTTDAAPYQVLPEMPPEPFEALKQEIAERSVLTRVHEHQPLVTATDTPVDGTFRSRHTVNRASEAQRTAAICGVCGRSFADGDTVVLAHQYLGFRRRGALVRQVMPCCVSCTPASRLGGCVAQPCLSCGRTVMRRRRVRRSFCSHRCSWRWYDGQRNVKRARARADRICLSCQRPFTPRRADAKTCSPACRQRAHRQRQCARDKASGAAA